MTHFPKGPVRLALALTVSFLPAFAYAQEDQKSDQEEIQRCESVRGQQDPQITISCEEIIEMGKPRKVDTVTVKEEKSK